MGTLRPKGVPFSGSRWYTKGEGNRSFRSVKRLKMANRRKVGYEKDKKTSRFSDFQEIKGMQCFYYVCERGTICQ